MEREFHRWLKDFAGRSKQPDYVQVGIGDDAAVLRGLVEGHPLSGLVVTTDGLAEGTHFELTHASLQLIGRKLIGVNLSDLAAMGSAPIAAVLNLNLPRSFRLEQAQTLYRGAFELAQQFQTPIIGGDTNCWDGPLVLSATLIGVDLTQRYQRRPWLLSNARVGDRIFVSGQFGGSLLGRHLEFEPRLNLARYLAQAYEIRSATDVSDSLSLDLSLMAQASGQQLGLDSLGIELQADRIPIHVDAFRRASQTGQPALEHALTDGEDFELIVAVDPQELPRIAADPRLQSGEFQLTEIGRFIEQPGFWLCRDNERQEFEPKGYSH